MSKIKVLPVHSASECQFYTKNMVGESICYVKQFAPTVSDALAIMEREGKDFTPVNWNSDCGGSPEKCSFLPILFEESDAEVTLGVSDAEVEKYLGGGLVESPPEKVNKVAEPKEFQGKSLTRATQVIAEFNPFSTEEEAETETEVYDLDSEKKVYSSETQAEPEVEHEEIVSEIPAAKAAHSRVQFKIFGPSKFKKPYQIWQIDTDLMIIPANIILSQPDPWLNKMSRGNVQRELDEILRKRRVKIGNLFQTSNGGNHPNGVQAKRIIHAVLAAETWVSNAHTITQMTPKCLFAADAMGAKTVVMTPFDCGTVDIHSAAKAQLTAIRKFLYSNNIESVENLYIVMTDQLSYDAFMNAYKEISYGANGFS